MTIFFNMHQRKESFTSYHLLQHHIHHIHILHTMSSLAHSYSLEDSLLWCIFDMSTLHTLYFHTFQYAPAQLKNFSLHTINSNITYIVYTYINHVIFITLILTQQFFAPVHILHIYSSYSLLSYFSICTSAKNVSSHTTSSKFGISLTYVSHFRPTAIYSNLLTYFHKITLIYTSFPLLDLVPFSLGLNGSLKPSKTRSKKNKKKRSNTL